MEGHCRKVIHGVNNSRLMNKGRPWRVAHRVSLTQSHLQRCNGGSHMKSQLQKLKVNHRSPYMMSGQSQRVGHEGSFMEGQ